MSIVYTEILVKIHGVNIKDTETVERVICENIKKDLLSETLQAFGINYRNQFDSDVEVELIEYAGEESV